MRQLSKKEAQDWLDTQGWLSLPKRDSLNYEISDPTGLTRYEGTYAEGSASAGCGMADVLLCDFRSPAFPGGLLWIARTSGSMEQEFILFRQILLAGGVPFRDWTSPYYLLEPSEYDMCFALIALTIMLGWDANLVLSNRRFLVMIDDEPFLTVICDTPGPFFHECLAPLGFKVLPLRVG
jgi:hypothetical protein